MGIHVGEDFGDAGEMISGSSRVVAGALFGGVGIQIPSYTLDLFADLARGTLPCPLEEEMLQKVRDPTDTGGLVTGTHRTPDADGGGLRRRHGATGHAETVR